MSESRELAQAIKQVIDQNTKKATSKTRIKTTGQVVMVNPDGTAVVDAGYGNTPVEKSSATVKIGDEVSVTIQNGRAWIDGNLSDPSASSVMLVETDVKANNALLEASRAFEAANAAEKDAERAAVAADAAEADAGRAATAAVNAETSAGEAATSASNAETSASTAATAATNAETSASQAATAASNAQTSAGQAATAAQAAQQQAQAATTAATEAKADAAEAKGAARSATTSANDALKQLSVVQDVSGVLEWVTQHGTYTKTTDTAIDPSKVYWVADSSMPTGYRTVAEPDVSQISNYYELTIDQALANFVASHLALTNDGLVVFKDDSSWKTITKADGWELQDEEGHAVLDLSAQGVGFNADYPQYIGDEDAYIIFTPATASKPSSIVIGGDYVQLGSNKTLSQWLSEMQQAVSDSASAKKAANDVPIVTLSSTNGTVFKRNLGITTTIIATIFTPGGKIDNAATLHSRFGSGAYLEWGWRDVVTDAQHTLINSDPRIIMDGFGLVISPDDVDAQAVITCSLNY